MSDLVEDLDRVAALTKGLDLQWPYVSEVAVKASATLKELEAERDEALNQLDSSRHSVEVLEKRVEKLMAQVRFLERKIVS